MRCILFVDDEPDLLAGLQNQLRRRRKEWNMLFAESGEAALARLREVPCDVLVTDMRMPGMDGLALLRRVQADHPGIVRIVLSGQAEQGPMMLAVAAAHHYLGKPVDPLRLQALLEQALRVRELMDNEPLRQAIGRCGSLPAAPNLYLALCRALENSEVAMRDVAMLIERDVVLSATVLKVVNSGLFSLPQPLLNIQRAVQCLGLVTIKNLVLAAELFAGGADQERQISRFHRHGVQVALLTRVLLPSDSHSDATQTAAMLHDIGQLVLVAQGRERGEDALMRSEESLYGTNHAAAGAYLLGLWGFPMHVVEVVAGHHRLALEQPLTPATATALAELLVQEQEADAPSAEVDAYAAAQQLSAVLPSYRTLARQLLREAGAL